MAKKSKNRAAVDIADELEIVRSAIADKKLVERKLTTDLLKALHSEKIDAAGNYQISKAVSLKVSDEEKAFQWAQENHALKIDTAKAKEILRHEFSDPEQYGFTKEEKERIIPKGTGDDE